MTKTLCCGYDISALALTKHPVHWNPFNNAIQCHNCGHIYEPKVPMEEINRSIVRSVNVIASYITKVNELEKTICFFASVIKSGEPWSKDCEERMKLLDQKLEPSGTEAAVCVDIASRQQVGLKKYGTTVANNPLTKKQWREHMYQELLDATVYLKREMQAEDKLVKAAEDFRAARAELPWSCKAMMQAADALVDAIPKL
jgi:hypothetical protein